MKYLIETALLTHGLRSLTNNYLLENWTLPEALIAWIYKGEIKLGTITKYLSFRTEAQSAIRIDCSILENALKNGVSGALTASGTMAVCKKLGIPAAVTCGMGGIGEIKGEELCPDLPALAEIPIILISTGPKDMLERKATVSWLTSHGVQVIGANRGFCTGYLFHGEPVKLQGVLRSAGCRTKAGMPEGELCPPLLIINEIPEKLRVSDRQILTEAIIEGKRAEQEGRYYHPAANGKIDEMTNGYSSEIQLASLLDNARLAGQIESSR